VEAAIRVREVICKTSRLMAGCLFMERVRVVRVGAAYFVPAFPVSGLVFPFVDQLFVVV
jgi:hypothetical protein